MTGKNKEALLEIADAWTRCAELEEQRGSDGKSRHSDPKKKDR
jgi:hypothetical protein